MERPPLGPSKAAPQMAYRQRARAAETAPMAWQRTMAATAAAPATLAAIQTIQLREYERRPVRLAEEQVRQLLATRLVTLSPRGGGEYEAAAGSVVGTVVLPSLR